MKTIELQNDKNFYYILGLLATDGHITYPTEQRPKQCYSCCLNLSHVDVDILYKIQKLLGGSIYNNKPKKISKDCEKYSYSNTWRIGDKDFVKYLINIGFTHNKTYTLNVTNWFNTLKSEYKTAFIRGCWDGDGSLNLHNRLTGTTKCSTNHFCSASIDFFKMVVDYFKPTNGKIKERTKNENPKATCSLYYFYLNGQNYIELSKIYDNLDITDLVINRKQNKWLEIKHYYTNIHTCRFYNSIYYGVMLRPTDKKWCGIIKHNYKNYFLGNYPHEKDAAISYDLATILFNKSHHKINFKETIDEYQNIINLSNKNPSDIPFLVKKCSLCSQEYKNKMIKTSQFKGLTFLKKYKRWAGLIQYSGQTIQIKNSYIKPEKIAEIRDKILLYLKPDINHSKLNFPENIDMYNKCDLKEHFYKNMTNNNIAKLSTILQ